MRVCKLGVEVAKAIAREREAKLEPRRSLRYGNPY